jgi:hypothetical protein
MGGPASGIPAIQVTHPLKKRTEQRAVLIMRSFILYPTCLLRLGITPGYEEQIESHFMDLFQWPMVSNYWPIASEKKLRQEQLWLGFKR